MPDREKVIERLQRVSCYFKSMLKVGYDGDAEIYREHRESVKMAIELLKEQEPKPVKVVKTEYDHELYYCPRCGRPFCDFYYVKPKFCDKCGQAVKWE